MNTLLDTIKSLKKESDVKDFLVSVFSSEEIAELEKRIEIVKLLLNGKSQREVADQLGVGIATVSRGAKEIKLGHFKFLTK